MIRLPARVPYLVALGVAAGLLVGSGCASRPDWIEATLVTVEVSGTWWGTLLTSGGGPNITTYVELKLDQRGALVTGIMRGRGATRFDGPVEGSVAGDVLRFQRADGRLRGEATVNGDEMAGSFVSGGYVPEGRLVLRRVDRAAPPPVPSP
jgi:hypothetical protein